VAGFYFLSVEYRDMSNAMKAAEEKGA